MESLPNYDAWKLDNAEGTQDTRAYPMTPEMRRMHDEHYGDPAEFKAVLERLADTMKRLREERAKP